MEVLHETMRIYKAAHKTAEEAGLTEPELFAAAIEAAAYRLYLLGVQDGMEAADCKRAGLTHWPKS